MKNHKESGRMAVEECKNIMNIRKAKSHFCGIDLAEEKKIL